MSGGATTYWRHWPLLQRHWPLLLLITIGAVIRFAVNNVTSFSPADETVYLNYARVIQEGRSGYEAVIRFVIDTPEAWPYPSPSRWAAFEADAAICRLVGCDFRALTLLSTLSGIALLPVVYAVGRRLLTSEAALLGTAFVVTSPLLLGLGRRALTDEFFVLTAWVAIWAVVRLLDRTGIRDYALAVVAMGVALGAKESFALFYVACATMFLIRPRRPLRRRDLALALGPPVVWILGFVLVGGTPTDLVAIERIFLSYRLDPGAYELVNGAGPAYQPILDFLILSPAVTLLAIAGWGAAVAGGTAGVQRLALLTMTCFIGFGILLKDIRYAAAVIPMLALLAGWAISERLLRPRGLIVVGSVAAAGVNACVDAWVFWTVFVVGGVYDPVLVNVLRALHAIP